MDLKHILLTLFLSTLCSAQPDFFYDFGTNNGDTSVEDDDMCVTFNQDFAILEGDIYQTVHFCTNGLFSFGGPLSRHDGYKPPVRTVPFLAAYWYDIDNSENALGADMIYYRESTAAADLSAVQQDIATEVGDTNFVPTWVAIGTWHETSVYFSPTQTVPDPQPQNTFQIAVATDGTTSYGVLNYGDISSSADGHNDYPQIGYNAGNDALTGFAPDISGTANAHTIKDGTNVKTTGQYIYLLTTLKPGPVCEAPPVIANTDITPDQQQPYTDNTIITYACASGYEVSGAGPETVTATCTFDDGWVPSNPSLSCVASQCTAPTGGSNVVSKPTAGTTYNVGETIQYDCLTGYEAPGQVTTTTITCQGAQAANEWSVEPPVCDRVTCADPGTQGADMSVSGVRSEYRYEDVLVYTCDTGFEEPGTGDTTRTITCGATGDFDGIALVCEGVICPYPGTGTNVVSTPSSSMTYRYEDLVDYECQPNYEAAGGGTSLAIECQADKTWSAPALTCIALGCSKPANGNNNKANPEDKQYNYGDTWVYECKDGYTSSGSETSRTVTCQSNPAGQWSSGPLNCGADECLNPDEPVQATKVENLKEPPTYLALDTIDYTCNEGFQTVDGTTTSTSTCTVNNVWNPKPIQCTVAICPIPSGSSNVKSNPTTTLLTGETFTYECNDGYVSEDGSGSKTQVITCTADGSYDTTPLRCERVSCDEAPDTSGSDVTITGMKAEYKFGDSMTFTCDEGYKDATTDVSTRTITCTSDGTFDMGPLDCQAVTCSYPGTGTNVQTSPAADDTYTYQDMVMYTCSTGYEKVAGTSETLTCQADGTWSGTALSCQRKTCAYPGVGTNVASSPDASDTYEYEDTATYVCQAGYKSEDGNTQETLICGADGVFVPPDAVVCNPVECPSPGDGTNVQANPDPDAKFVYSNTFTYRCLEGYATASNSAFNVIECRSNGEWSAPATTCSRKSCSYPGTGSNVANPPDPDAEFKFGDVVTYNCNTGFELPDGSNSLTSTCGSNGEFAPAAPVCQAVTCTSPGDGTNVKESPATGDTFTYNDKYTFECLTNYETSTGDETDVLTCGADGSFDKPATVCTIKKCEYPGAGQNVKSIPDSSVDYPVGAIVDYECQDGYVAGDGTSTSRAIECLSTKLWNNPALICAAGVCSYPGEGTNVQANPDPDATYVYLDTVTYRCLDGYVTESNVGFNVLTCSNTGDWSDTATTCSRKSCTYPGTGSNVANPPDSQTDFKFEDVVIYNCNTGFELADGSKSLTSTCGANGEFAPAAPVCQAVTCTSPGEGTNVKESPAADATFRYDEKYTFECLTNYETSTGDEADVLSCGADGSFDKPATVCSMKICEYPGAGQNVKSTPDISGDYPVGTIVDYECQDGYVAGDGTSTSRAIECLNTKLWNNPALICAVAGCNAPPSGTGVVTSPEDRQYTIGETVVYNCKPGYVASGNVKTKTITCLDDPMGTWDGGALTCSADECLTPSDPVKATKVENLKEPPNFLAGDTIDYTCNDGFQTADGTTTLTITCTDNNVWNPKPIQCTVAICDDPPTVTNVEANPTGVDFTQGTSFKYTCIDGYVTTAGGTDTEVTITCGADGEFDAQPPSCTRIACPPAPTGTASVLAPVQAAYLYNDLVTYTCNNGYTASGGTSSSITCQADGTWSGTGLVCVEMTCDAPADGDNSQFTGPTDYTLNAVVSYTCNTGYEGPGGIKTRDITCLQSGWDGSELDCTIVNCADPPAGANMDQSGDTSPYTYQESVTLTCEAGYEYAGGDKAVTITCGADKQWSQTVGTCERIECPTPTAPSNSAISPVRTVYKFGDQLTHKCDAGYSDNGLTDRLIQCRADGLWSGPLLDCQPIMCPQPLEGTNAERTNPSSYTVGMNVTYTCNDNHQAADMSTTKTITCQMDGTWSGTPLVCILIDDSCKGDADCKSEHGIYSYCEGGSGECLCILGFVMTNGICVDDNECLGDHKCDDANENLFGVEDGTCVNLDGTQGTGYYCSCIAGFIWVDVDPGCKDIDECQTSNAGCADQCTNKFVDRDGIRYECSCTDPTKELAPDKHACIDRTKCAADTCKTLYENGPCGTPGACEDSVAPVDCRNVGGTFQCICDLGYGWDEATKSCKNLNECTLQTDLCEDGCVDKVPHTDTVTYECNCDGLPGYVLSTTDRHNCVDQNECANPNTNSCDDPISTCVNNVGSYTCTCPDNMQWNAATRKCDSVNECLTDNGGCDHICRDGVSGAICSCRPGYSLGPDSKTCTDFNECLNSNDNDCDHICTNTPAGSYTCSCRTGYVLNSDRQSCTDLCALNNGGCEQICNTTSSGTVQCQCWEGYAIMSNGINCGFEYMIIRHEINMPWEPTYGDENHPDNEQLKNDLIAEMRRVYGIQGTSPASAIESYEILQPFKHDSNSITVDAKVTFVDPVNAEDLSYISYDVFERLQDKEFKFNIRTTDYSLDNTLHFVYRPPIGQEQVWSISATCHFYDQTGVCKSDEECFVSDTNRPECRPKCKDNDSRPECPQRGQLLPMEYIIIIIIIFILICILIIIIACVLNRRKNRRTIIETYSTGTESSMSPMPTMIAPLYKSSSMLYNAPVYGTKQI